MKNITPAISVSNVSKTFRIPHERYSSLKQNAINLLAQRSYTNFVAVDDISFEVYPGDFFGIVGRNGSGKSTLLKMLAGIYVPSKGAITVNGTLSPFIELGVGFNPELTARENVFLNGAILGLTHEQIETKFEEIFDFSELHEFKDQKLKNFSSGMQVRLAFAIAIQAQSGILLIDEVLAVGDENFQQKCFRIFRRLKREGKTIVFVSHDMESVRNFCNRAILLHKGKIVASGKPEQVVVMYNRLNLEDTAQLELNHLLTIEMQAQNTARWGTKQVVINKISTTYLGRPKSAFAPGEQIELHYDIHASEEISHPVIGCTIRNTEGLRVLVTNTKVLRIETPVLASGSDWQITCNIPNYFANDVYSVSPAIASTDTDVFYDWWEDACQFQVGGQEMGDGLIHPNPNFTFNPLR